MSEPAITPQATRPVDPGGHGCVTLRPVRRDAAGRRLDPDCAQLLDQADRLDIPIVPGPGLHLLEVDAAHAGAAIALVVATPMRQGLFRGVEIWHAGRRPPAHWDYALLERGELVAGQERRRPGGA